MKTFHPIVIFAFLAMLAQAGIGEAQGNEAAFNVSGGVEHSDNPSRSSGLVVDGKQEEVAYKGGLDFRIDSRSSAYRLNASGSVERRQYKNGIFDDETVGRLVGNLDWTLLEERLFWNFSANHGQQIVDPFQAITPRNREDVTIVSLGPMLTLPIATRTFLVASVSQSEARYELRPLDNTRVEGGLSLERQIAPTRNVSLNMHSSRVEYDEDQLLPPLDQLNASIGFESESTRNQFSVNVGWDYFERQAQEADGPFLDLAFRRAITESASLSISASSKFSTNDDVFLTDQERQSLASSDAIFDTGALDIQGFGDVFRNDRVGIVYSQSFGRTNLKLSGSWGAEKYETITGLDREVTAVRASLGRELSQAMSISVFASFSNRDYGSVDRADEDSTYGLSFTARLGRKFSLSLGARQLQRDSNLAEFDYDETRADLTVSYAVL
jgi:hypothetical protein